MRAIRRIAKYSTTLVINPLAYNSIPTKYVLHQYSRNLALFSLIDWFFSMWIHYARRADATKTAQHTTHSTPSKLLNNNTTHLGSGGIPRSSFTLHFALGHISSTMCHGCCWTWSMQIPNSSARKLCKHQSK